LVNIFTREYGRLTLIAKGCRRKKSAVRGLLLPFKPLLLSWAGKGQLPILTGAEQSGHLPELNRLRLFSGYYINELIIKLLHRYDAHDRLFDQYHLSVLALMQSESPHRVLRVFEKNLLKEIGFGLVLDHDVETGEMIKPDQRYRYVPERGPVGISQDRYHGLVIYGKTLQALDREAFDDEITLSESRRLVRALIHLQLNGKEPRSRRVMSELNKYGTKINTATKILPG